MNILVATDTSACSQAAIESVMAMGYGSGTEIKAITVVDLFEPLLAIHQEKAMEQARQYIASVVDKVKAALPQTKVSGGVVIGYADQMIIQTAHEFKANLIVMGSHGRTGLTRFLWGSISRAVMLDSPCSVRIVRHVDTDKIANNHVLIALDESQNSIDSAYILQHVLESSWTEGTKFKCISVVSEEYKYIFFDPALASGLAGHREDILSNAASSLRQRVNRLNLAFGEGSASYEVLEGDARVRILEQAKEWNAAVIVMGTHGRKGVEEILLGSVADAVSSHAPSSVEIVRHQAKQPAKMHVII
jgi:nucleotide-binding universal stress UspA family protein